jgi:glycosyltransferase involved in cell wall biosynthesis
LKSIDAENAEDIEIVICDDKSPDVERVRKVVSRYQKETEYAVRLYENAENLNYDRNIQELVEKANGEWIMFMGDDDEFVSGALNTYIAFLREHNELGYVMKSHITVRKGGDEKFRYYDGTKFFPAGEKTFAEIFRKSVFISGFTIRRKFLPEPIHLFDSSLLYQHYLLGEVVLHHPSAYLDEVLVKQYDDSVEVPDENNEQKPHAARVPSVATSLRFLKSFIQIPEYFDTKYGTHIAPAVLRDMSKYFYPTLAVHRNKGVRVFLEYTRALSALGYNTTIYFYVYVALLLIFGKDFCDWGIMVLKRILKKTPRL